MTGKPEKRDIGANVPIMTADATANTATDYDCGGAPTTDRE